MSDIDDHVVEAILGPELTRKLDDYIAQQEVQHLHRPRSTRLSALKTAIEVVTGLAQTAIDHQRREQEIMDKVRLLRAKGLNMSKIAG